jgi:two-component system, NarL family, response regulator NreC
MVQCQKAGIPSVDDKIRRRPDLQLDCTATLCFVTTSLRRPGTGLAARERAKEACASCSEPLPATVDSRDGRALLAVASSRRCRAAGAHVPPQILLADDHEIVREGLKALLEHHNFDVVGEASDGRQAVQLATKLRPDVAVFDYSMPLMNGLEAAREIQRISPPIKTVLLTMHTEDLYVFEALRAGIRGYVVKTQASADLVRAIQEVARGQIYLSPGISGAIVEAYLTKTELPVDPLTPQERRVLLLIAEGKRTKEIAHILETSVKTAESHRARIMAKLDIHETAGLVRYAIRRGVIEP